MTRSGRGCAVRVIVVGGGAVGLCVAEALAARGAEVTVLERDRCGAGASAGNAGWITPSLVDPCPGPRGDRRVAALAGRTRRGRCGSARRCRRRCSAGSRASSPVARAAPTGAGSPALQRPRHSPERAFDRLAERGVEFELHDEPLLYPAFDAAELEHLLAGRGDAAGGGQHPAARAAVGGRAARARAGARAQTCRWSDRARRAAGAAGARCPRASPQRSSHGASRSREHSPVTRAAPATTRAVDRRGRRRQPARRCGRARGRRRCRGLLAALGMRLPIAAAKGYSRTYRRDPTGRGGLCTSRPRRSRSASTTAACACRARSSSVPAAWRCPPAPGRDHRGRRARAAGLADAGPAARLGRHALAVARRPAVHRPGARRSTASIVATAHATLGITLAR